MPMFFALHQVLGSEAFDRGYRDFFQRYRSRGEVTAEPVAAFQGLPGAAIIIPAGEPVMTSGSRGSSKRRSHGWTPSAQRSWNWSSARAILPPPSLWSLPRRHRPEPAPWSGLLALDRLGEADVGREMMRAELGAGFETAALENHHIVRKQCQQARAVACRHEGIEALDQCRDVHLSGAVSAGTGAYARQKTPRGRCRLRRPEIR
jgi:hypothetical protein